MRSQVTKTVSSCFAVLRQLRSVRLSLPRSIIHTLVTFLVLTRLDFGNATLAGIPQYQLKRLQSVMNAAARLVFSSCKFDNVTPLLRQLHWLKAPERIDYKLAVRVYKCQHGSAPPYLADELCRPADIEGRRCLRSASSVTIADCAPNSAVNRRRPGFSGCCLSCLERSATARHGCRISACLLQSPQDSSLWALLSVTPLLLCPRSDCVIPDTLIVFVS